MNIAELKQKLNNNEITNLYIFFGEEYYVMDLYIKIIQKISGLTIKCVDSVESFINKLNNKNIFGVNYLYLVNNDRNVSNSETALSVLKNNKSKNIVVLIYDNIDKRTKFYTTNKDIIVEFEKMSDSVIQKHIVKDIGLTSDNAARLCKRCNSDYGRVKLCEQKLNILKQIYKNKDINYIYDKAVEDNVVPLIVSDVLLDFIDAVMDKDVYGSYFLYSVLKEYGTTELQIIAYLYNSFKNTLLVQSCGRNDNIPARTGLSSFIVNEVKQYVGTYYTAKLVRILRRLRFYEYGIKTGEIDSEFVMDSLLLDIFEADNG